METNKNLNKAVKKTIPKGLSTLKHFRGTPYSILLVADGYVAENGEFVILVVRFVMPDGALCFSITDSARDEEVLFAKTTCTSWCAKLIADSDNFSAFEEKVIQKMRCEGIHQVANYVIDEIILHHHTVYFYENEKELEALENLWETRPNVTIKSDTCHESYFKFERSVTELTQQPLNELKQLITATSTKFTAFQKRYNVDLSTIEEFREFIRLFGL